MNIDKTQLFWTLIYILGYSVIFYSLGTRISWMTALFVVGTLIPAQKLWKKNPFHKKKY